MQPTPTLHLAPPPARSSISRAWPLLAAASLILFGCRDPKIASYRVAKEASAELPATAPVHASAAEPQAMPPPPMSAPAGVPGAAPSPGSAHDSLGLQTASGAGLSWTADANWQAKPAGGMRKASYTVTGEGGATADLAVTAFPGDVGGEIANVNRWRGQVGLAPLSDADALASIQRIETNGLKVGVVDVAAEGATATRLIGAFVPYEGATWFFKLLGPDAVVAKQKPAFLEFLKTIKPAAAATP
jgi:hypothetical protein